MGNVDVDPKKMEEAKNAIGVAIQRAEDAGDTGTAEKLKKVLSTLTNDRSDDFLVINSEGKSMLSAIDGAVNDSRSGAELNMIEIQSLVSKRATALQLTTSMLNSINESAKGIAGNIGR
jgi:NDP-sugar pyrophosphorylase family protein